MQLYASSSVSTAPVHCVRTTGRRKCGSGGRLSLVHHMDVRVQSCRNPADAEGCTCGGRACERTGSAGTGSHRDPTGNNHRHRRGREEQLPEVGAARQAVVVLRMCGCTQIGSPVLGVLERYAQQMQAGVSDQVMAQLRKTETTDTIAEGDIFLETATLGQATQAATAAAERWIRRQQREDTLDGTHDSSS